MEIIIQQVRVIDPATASDRIADVKIMGQQITAIAPQLSPGTAAVRDGRGLVLGPGLVDLYSHCSEPGHEERETLAMLGAAALAGGYGRLALLPDTRPPADNPAALALLLEKTGGIPRFPRLGVWGGLTRGLEGEQMAELGELAPTVVGFSDGVPLENLGLLRQILDYAQPFGKPIALAAGDRHLKGQGVLREGVASLRYGLPGDPALSETTAIAALLELAAGVKIPIHLMRVSTRRGVELIAQGKARGLPLTASTTWMHLLFNEEAAGSYDPNFRLEPPLGSESDRLALVEAVKTGAIDAIASDRAPYTYEEKMVAFADAPPGVVSFELILSRLWERFVVRGELTALELWTALSAGPLRCLQEPVAGLATGRSPMILFDPKAVWTANAQTLNSRSSNTPWWGQEVRGRVLEIWL